MTTSTDNLARFVVRFDATIWMAMNAINENFCEVVLVEDGAGRIQGLITDGDIRRGLLRGLSIQVSVENVMTREFRKVDPSTDRAAALDVMKALDIKQLPVLDHDNRLIGMHLLRDLIGSTPRTNCAVIMAGGRGTRLRPLTETVPKPMVPVAGRPILERIVLHLVGCGIRHIYLAVNYLSEQIEAHFSDGAQFGCTIEYLREDQELGTAGALSLLSRRPSESFIVMNGDYVTRPDLAALFDFHAAQAADLTIVAGTYEHQIPFGVIGTDGDQFTSLQEKPTIAVTINRGIYLLEPSALDFVPRNRFFTMVDLIADMHAAGRHVAVRRDDGEWIDVGRIGDLVRANGVEA